MSEPLRTWPVMTLPMSRGRNGPQQPHQAQGLEAHVAQVLGAAVAFVEAGEELDLVADFGVGGEVFGLDAAAGRAVWRPCVWR